MLLDEPTSQLDPVAGDELIWLLRRLNEEWGTAVVLAEHRLERCLAHADRVVVVDDGAHRLRRAAAADARLGRRARARAADARRRGCSRAPGLRPLPAGVKEARATLRAHGLLAAARPRAGTRRRAARGAGSGACADGAAAAAAALAAPALWHELRGGRAILRGVDLDSRRASASR